jgi:hypothetical protein
MAYLRKEKETMEIDYPLAKVWAAIPEGLMSYPSNLTVDGVPVDENKCRVTVQGETPVTTITAITDFGRTSDRISLFFETLAKQLNSTEKS